MASATGIPQEHPDSIAESGEDEPLLGKPGDVTQSVGHAIATNLITGELCTLLSEMT
jgi:hypothetical protein